MKENYTRGNCPYCDAEHGFNSSWGMSPEGFTELKKAHDEGHPEFEKPKENLNWENMYPINTFKGETQKELIELLKEQYLKGKDEGMNYKQDYADEAYEKGYKKGIRYITYAEKGIVRDASEIRQKTIKEITEWAEKRKIKITKKQWRDENIEREDAYNQALDDLINHLKEL